MMGRLQNQTETLALWGFWGTGGRRSPRNCTVVETLGSGVAANMSELKSAKGQFPPGSTTVDRRAGG